MDREAWHAAVRGHEEQKGVSVRCVKSAASAAVCVTLVTSSSGMEVWG